MQMDATIILLVIASFLEFRTFLSFNPRTEIIKAKINNKNDWRCYGFSTTKINHESS